MSIKSLGSTFNSTLNYEFEPYIDITLQKENEIKRLRFLSPINLKLKKQFTMTHGFCIIDSAHKFLNHKIEVTDFEEDLLYFRARKVVDLDKITETELEILALEFTYNLET